MAETAATEPVKSSAPLNWKTFLENHPPEAVLEVTEAVVRMQSGNLKVSTKPIQLYCDSSDCGGTRWFDHREGEIYPEPNSWRKGIAVYSCRHCKKTTKEFALYVRMGKDL